MDMVPQDRPEAASVGTGKSSLEPVCLPEQRGSTDNAGKFAYRGTQARTMPFMPARRRYPEHNQRPDAWPGEQPPAGEGSPTPREAQKQPETGGPMADKPLHIVDSDSWWSPQDADLPVGQEGEASEPEPKPIPARRLLIAGVVIFVLTTVTVVFLPDIVAVLSPMGAMIAFAAIVASAVVTAAPRQPKPERDGLDDAKPITCGGVRPVGEMSRRAARKKDGGCGPSCGC